MLHIRFMSRLKLADLEVGKLYRCSLSNRKMLILSSEPVEVPEILEEDSTNQLKVEALVYESGSYKLEEVFDCQLESL